MLLIGNGRVLTRDKNAPYFPDGAVLIDGEQIRAVGDRRELQNQYPEAEWIDACGGVIMPGLINTHTHIYSGLARGLSIKGNNPRSFPEILEGTWWNIDRHLTPDGTKACAYATILECIRNGVTTIFDHHASFGQVQVIPQKTEQRFVLLGGIVFPIDADSKHGALPFRCFT